MSSATTSNAMTKKGISMAMAWLATIRLAKIWLAMTWQTEMNDIGWQKRDKGKLFLFIIFLLDH